MRRAKPKRAAKTPYRAGKIPIETPNGVFLPDKEQLVRLIAMKGADDDEIEDVFGVPRGVLRKWRELYPSLSRAIEKGRSAADGDVLYQTYRNAVGFEYQEEQAVGGKHPCVLKVKKHARADPGQQRYWLNNRLGWRSTERLEHTGANGGDIGIKHETRDEIIDAVLALVKPKPDNEVKPAKDTAR